MLPAGARIGHYEVIAPLGAGGMGEVYRARDTRLKREVALKILPTALVGDPDRMRRFEQEAMAAGMLNHPNVLTVFDVGSHEGTPFIISELLEGSRLRDHMLHHLPSKTAIEFAVQIANGLAAAHEKGIVHRDLKPENVFVLADGRLKLLDFGLVKLLQPEFDSDETNTQAHGATNPGIVVGTVGYMSPEQVRGDAVDHRSDIFSLGVILYEMISGSQPFRRESSVETMNAVIHDEPPSVADVHPAIARVIRHAMEKNPANRFQSAKDLAFALDAVGSSDSLPSLGGKKRPAPKKAEAAAPQMPLYRRMTFRRGFIMSARFAPDGSVVYGAAWEDHPLEIFSSYQTGPEARPLALHDADILSVSSTGELAISLGRRFIGVGYATTGTLARVPLAGGAPRRVCQDVQEAQWTADGKNFLVIRRIEGFYRIESPIGNVIYRTPRWISRARFSPKEDLIAFIEHPVWGDDAGTVIIINREGGQIVRGTETWNSTSGLAWTPKGDEVWFTGEAIGKGRGRDVMSLSVTGRERVVLPVPGRLTLHDISSDGRVLLAIENGRREAVVGHIGEPQERNLSWFDWSRLSGISHDGTFIVFEEQAAGVQGQNTVFIRTTDGAPAVRIVEGRARGNPISVDGEWLAVAIGQPPHIELVATGVGEPAIVKCQLDEFFGWQFFPDGKRLLILGNRSGQSKQLFEVAVDGDGTPRPLAGDIPLSGSFALSHDGKTIAAGSDNRVMLIPVDGSEPRAAAGCGAGDIPLEWSDDDRAIFVSQRGQASLKVHRVDVTSGERREWVTIDPDDPAGILDIMPVHITPDGQTYAYGYRRLLSDLYIVTGLL
ncbi:MAG TPA: protein kinase [Thermoanaerobaculia bacterium]|nr:protein kinase [Thermoanaerobaculia bacterium]